MPMPMLKPIGFTSKAWRATGSRATPVVYSLASAAAASTQLHGPPRVPSTPLRRLLSRLKSLNAFSFPLLNPAALPRTLAGGLDNLGLDLRHSVRGAGPTLEALSRWCPRIRALRLGRFYGICNTAWLHFDGVAICEALQSLCVQDCSDLTNSLDISARSA